MEITDAEYIKIKWFVNPALEESMAVIDAHRKTAHEQMHAKMIEAQEKSIMSALMGGGVTASSEVSPGEGVLTIEQVHAVMDKMKAMGLELREKTPGYMEEPKLGADRSSYAMKYAAPEYEVVRAPLAFPTKTYDMDIAPNLVEPEPVSTRYPDRDDFGAF